MIRIGSSASITFVVDEASTAIALGSGDVPVLGTPKVVALMEQAAVEAIGDQLPGRLTTVGTEINIAHLAPSAVGSEVTAHAHVIKIDSGAIIFTVELFDGDELVAEGVHIRAVIDRARFLSRLAD